MSQPQGPRSFDPYRILQLQAHTSHDLIVESYWALVARAKAHDNESAIRALNAAYELLTNGERRSAYDREHGYALEEPPPARKNRKERQNGSAAAPDHYSLLAVDPAADGDIIELAYRVGMRKAAGYHPDLVLLRNQLTEAFQTLSNHELRAKYDASVSLAHAGNGVQNAGPAKEATPEQPAPGDVSNQKRSRDDGPPGRSAKRGFFALFERQGRGTPDDGATPSRGQAPPRIAEEAARGERLLQLRPFGAEVLAGAMRRPPEPERPPMAALSITGPLGTERVPLPPRTITIGASGENDIVLPARRIAPEQVRMWPHGESFALRVTGRGPVRVGGVEPALAVLLLEDGDVIELSEFRLTFHNSPRA